MWAVIINFQNMIAFRRSLEEKVTTGFKKCRLFGEVNVWKHLKQYDKVILLKMCCEKLYDFKLFLVDPVLFSAVCLAHKRKAIKKKYFFALSLQFHWVLFLVTIGFVKFAFSHMLRLVICFLADWMLGKWNPFLFLQVQEQVQF